MAQQPISQLERGYEKVPGVVVEYLQYAVTAIPFGLLVVLIIWSGS